MPDLPTQLRAIAESIDTTGHVQSMDADTLYAAADVLAGLLKMVVQHELSIIARDRLISELESTAAASQLDHANIRALYAAEKGITR